MEIDPAFSVTQPIRQGDLIACSQTASRHPFDRFGVIVTADCDLERLRPDHQVTFLRVAPVTDYVRHVWCRKKIHALLSTLQKDAATSFNTISQKLDPQRVQLLPRRLAEWLSISRRFILALKTSRFG